MRRLLIVFPDEWLAYSPTVLNLASGLDRDFAVTIVAVSNRLYRHDGLERYDVEWILVPRLLSRALHLLRLYKPLKALLLRARLRRLSADVVIAVDSLGLWAALARWPRCHLLSLEVKRDWFFRRCDASRVSSVIIQSQERYRYLFGQAELPRFLIQNAPVFQGEPPAPPAAPLRVVYYGNVIPRHGVYQCLSALALCPEVQLTIKGPMSAGVDRVIRRRFAPLLAQGRLVLDSRYLAPEDVISYLAGFHAGFCLYDFARIDPDDFNYLSVPSGKLFSYYAAGVPVIGSDILGLRSIRDFDTGVALARLGAEEIADAIRQVVARHSHFRRNCLSAARHFDFARALAPFRARVTGEAPPRAAASGGR